MLRVVSGFTTFKSVIKIVAVWIFAFLLPKVYVWYWQPATVVHPAIVSCCNGTVQGADLLFAVRNTPKTKALMAIGLVTDDMSRLGTCASTADFLLKKGMRVKKVFVPWYAHAANRTVSVGKAHKIPVVRIAQDGIFTKSQVSGVDLLVFALQDSRMGHALYAAALAQTMRAATLYKKMLVIMDHHHDTELMPWQGLKKYAWGTGDALSAYGVPVPLEQSIYI